MRLIHQAGLSLVETWEGLFLDAYRDIAGVWTIGWGHTGGVYKGERCDRMQAEQWLTLDLADAAGEVNARCGDIANDNEFDALTSFTFNEGKGALRSSTLLRLFKEGKVQEAADQFPRWDKAHVDGRLVEVRGLLNRRRAERALFLGKPSPALSRDSLVRDYHLGRRGLVPQWAALARTADRG